MQQAQARIRELLNRDKKDSKGTDSDYRQALLLIANNINAFIVQYGEENGLSPTEAAQKVNDWDLKQWKQAIEQLDLSNLSPEAKVRYQYYAKMAGINRGYLITAIIGLALLWATDKQQTRIKQRISRDASDVQRNYKVSKRKIDKIVAENANVWSSNLWLKSDAMTDQVQAAVNKKLSSTLTYDDVARMFDYSNSTLKSASRQAVSVMVSSTDRLLRTESARVIHQAKIAAFKKHHIVAVDMVVEPGVCEECEEIQEGSPFLLKNAPDIPIHPNCRCTIVPHFESDVELSF